MSVAVAHRQWQAARQAELAGPDSWCGLRGLFWLSPGRNTVGSAAGSGVELPHGPACLGHLDWAGEVLRWQPLDGLAQDMHTDRDGLPTTIAVGDLAFFVVERAGRLAVRLRDRQWARQAAPPPLRSVDYAPAWAFDADWVELQTPLVLTVPNVSGELKEMTVRQRAVFTVDGLAVSLLPMTVGEAGVFFVFRDRSSGRTSYGAGRFLNAPLPVDGRLRLDFNFAYNPPCAFTPFATCPLPPPENWLPFAVEAGELKPGG